ncbi:hypothetical protein KF840_11965 [bacterium]|nr:hypothetical protein [bacterium]
MARGGAIAFGVLAALVLLEIVLRLGASVVPEPSALRGGTAPRLLCLGDSNTYGIFLPTRDDAYPHQLHLALGRRGQRVDVINLGYPGNNSSRIRAALPSALATVRPDTVTVMVGANDFWTVPEPLPAAGDGWPSIRQWLWRHSRAFRFLFMLRQALSPRGAAPEVTYRADPAYRLRPEDTATLPADLRGEIELDGQRFAGGFERKEGGVPNWQVGLRDNLAAIVAAVRDSGAEVVLITYPSEQDAYRFASQVIREVAAETGAPLIDLGVQFRALCPAPPCPDIFYPDGHPTAAGHAAAGERVANWLVEHGAGGAPRQRR